MVTRNTGGDTSVAIRLVVGVVFAAVVGAAHAQVQAPATNPGTDEVFVTGSRISRQGFDAPTPVTAIDSDYLLSLGFVNVGAAVQQLPSNKASLTPETNGFGSFNVGAEIANLRALGAQRTLTLIDVQQPVHRQHGHGKRRPESDPTAVARTHGNRDRRRLGRIRLRRRGRRDQRHPEQEARGDSLAGRRLSDRGR